MPIGFKKTMAFGVGLAVVAAGAVVFDKLSQAADHLDPPSRTDPAMGGNDRNADIADVYAWHTGSGAEARLVLAYTFSGPNAPGGMTKIPCDRDVLYTIHVQPGMAGEPADDTAQHMRINVRLGSDDVGNCFATFEGLPNVPAPITIRTEAPVRMQGFNLFAGLRDDAFFFDLDGFRQTLAMGTVKMISDRDFFAKKNTPAFVVEMPLPAGAELKVWGTAARIK
jgi:hypothetical protein